MDATKNTVLNLHFKGISIRTLGSRHLSASTAQRVFPYNNISKNTSTRTQKQSLLSVELEDVLNRSVKEGNFVCIAERTRATRRKSTKFTHVSTKLVEFRRNKLKCKLWTFYVSSLPDYFKQINEIKEHQNLMKDLKNSRTLPILSSESLVSFDLSNYWLCNMSIVTFQPPKIILPSPSPLLKEQEVFPLSDWIINEGTNESTPMQVMRTEIAPGTFSSEYFKFYATFTS